MIDFSQPVSNSIIYFTIIILFILVGIGVFLVKINKRNKNYKKGLK
jgi:CHASE3 domain sensor protein